MRKMTCTRRAGGFTLVEILCVILVLGVLIAIALPNFIRARDSAQRKSCLANLTQIETAKDRYAADKGKHDGDPADWADITPAYIRYKPTCPTGVEYSVNAIGANPTCVKDGHVLR